MALILGGVNFTYGPGVEGWYFFSEKHGRGNSGWNCSHLMISSFLFFFPIKSIMRIYPAFVHNKGLTRSIFFILFIYMRVCMGREGGFQFCILHAIARVDTDTDTDAY
jgi:hypothetical protein